MLCNSHTRLVFIFTAVGILVGMAGAFACCRDGWVKFGNSCYKNFTERNLRATGWVDAYERCSSLGSRLLKLGTSGEAEFVKSIIDGDEKTRIILECTVDLDSTPPQCSDSDVGEEKLRMLRIDPSSQTCLAMKPFSSRRDQISFTTIECFDRPVCFVCEYEIENTRCVAVGSPTMPHPCLLDHTYKEIPLLHPIHCCLACRKDSDCKSLNLSGKMCQFNNATIAMIDTDKYVQLKENCTYYQFQ